MMRSTRATASSTTRSRRHHAVDQAELVGTRRGDRVARHHDLQRGRLRNALGQPDRTAGRRQQTALGFGEPERRGVGRDHEIAREHELEPTGERRALHRRDEGLDERTLDDPAEPALLRLDVLRVAASATTFRSAPAQNTGPAPVRITAPTARSASISSSASSIACESSGLIALRASGRFNRRISIRPRRSRSRIMSMALLAATVGCARYQRFRGAECLVPITDERRPTWPQS